jgi:hypothetical protein
VSCRLASVFSFFEVDSGSVSAAGPPVTALDQATNLAPGTDVIDQTRAPFPWRTFLERHQLPYPAPDLQPSLELLRRITRAFASIPVENATELLLGPSFSSRRRTSRTLIIEHLLHGTGGTPFALVNSLGELLELYRFDTSYHLGFTETDPERQVRPDHAALIVVVQERMFVCDPGMLIEKPLWVPGDEHLHLYADARETELLIERTRDGRLLIMLRAREGFRQTHTIDLLQVSRVDLDLAWAEPPMPGSAPPMLRVERIIEGRLWRLRGGDLLCRSSDGDEAQCHASWEAIARRFGMQTAILKRAYARTPSARISRRVMRGLRGALKGAVSRRAA